MSKRKSNKKVKAMMADVFDGEWHNYNSNGGRFYGNGMRLHVFGGWLCDLKTTVELHKVISLTADQLRGVK